VILLVSMFQTEIQTAMLADHRNELVKNLLFYK